MRSATQARRRYDWRACTIALIVAFAVTVPAALAATRLIESALFLVAVVTTVGTIVSRWTYERFARRGSRPLDSETCPM